MAAHARILEIERTAAIGASNDAKTLRQRRLDTSLAHKIPILNHLGAVSIAGVDVGDGIIGIDAHGNNHCIVLGGNV